MPQPRHRIVDTAATTYYHCISRCVRRAYLCGTDRVSGKSFDHRKQWIVDRIKKLSSVFAIEVCAYAIMSNHFHVVLHIDKSGSANWDMDEIIDRWERLFKLPYLVERYKSGEKLGGLEYDMLVGLVTTWRDRLGDLSWFMRCLNERIARLANAEDSCSGRFWEGRFKSQALLDEGAVMSCMAYVDLNPIRAGVCKSVETSTFTSIHERLVFAGKSGRRGDAEWLKPLRRPGAKNSQRALMMNEFSYFNLVDWTGRAIRCGKRGAIPDHIQPILGKLGIQTDNWVSNIQSLGQKFYRVLGCVERLRQLAKQQNQCWVNGLTTAEEFYC
ncbi:MAG: transposase [Pseudohongiellaceae bacterium]